MLFLKFQFLQLQKVFSKEQQIQFYNEYNAAYIFSEFNSVLNRLMVMTNVNVDEMRVQNETWAQQVNPFLNHEKTTLSWINSVPREKS